MVRAIGFDLGDTLLYYADTPLDWSSLYGDALAAVARVCIASPIPAEISAACQILVGYNTRVHPRSTEVSADEIFSQILRSWSLPVAEHLEIAVEAFFTFFQQRMCAFPETLRALHSLRGAGLRLGVLTDVPYGMPMKFVRRDLDGAQISNLLDSVVTSAMVGLRKPEPAGYHVLASSLGVAPSEMLFVGNEPKDGVGAQRAGITSVLIDRTGGTPSHGQNFTVTSLSAVIDIAFGSGAPN
jgi:putative hydrolase of the HAD superfamily